MRGIALVFILLAITAAPASDPPAAERVSLRTLDNNPDHYLGETVSIEGIMLKEIAITSTRAALVIRTAENEKPTNLEFAAPISLAQRLRDGFHGERRKVRIIGVVMAPTTPNGLYAVEVEELDFLSESGTVTGSFKPVVLPVEKPAAAPVAPPPPPAAVEPAPEEVASDLPLVAILGMALLVIAACLLVGFLLLRRKPAAVAPPARSVSDRLNRRIR